MQRVAYHLVYMKSHASRFLILIIIFIINNININNYFIIIKFVAEAYFNINCQLILKKYLKVFLGDLVFGKPTQTGAFMPVFPGLGGRPIPTEFEAVD